MSSLNIISTIFKFLHKLLDPHKKTAHSIIRRTMKTLLPFI